MNQKNIISVLDAGGTNLKFTAIQNGKEIMKPIYIESAGNNLEDVLKKIIEGFSRVEQVCNSQPLAISFCFPGPADYPNGIIGNLENLPHFRGGVALKNMLENHFHIPVFINNDGDLYAYGEAINGFLPKVNKLLEANGNPRRYKNLLGITIGTGLGGGIIIDGKLLGGDNSAGGEINRFRNTLYLQTSVEDSVSIRGVKRVYAQQAGIDFAQAPEPAIISKIARGEALGNHDAALAAWKEMATVLADVIANAVSMVDSLVVIGGGLSRAADLFMPEVVRLLNSQFTGLNGNQFSRMELSAYNLLDAEEIKKFTTITGQMIKVPFSNQEVWYDPVKKIGIGAAERDTSSMVAIGAYAYAMHQLGIQ